MRTVHTYPPAEPHRIMTSAIRTLAPPVPAASVRRQHDIDDFRDQPEKKRTQEEQDAYDENARKRVMGNLVNSWQERLQQISVITTFFATTEAAILVNTKPSSGDDWRNNVLQASNASLLGALIVHIYAAVLSFLAAFLLISYKLREAKREEMMIMEGILVTDSPLGGPVIGDTGRGPIDQRTLTRNDGKSTMSRSAKHGMAMPAPCETKVGLCPLQRRILSAVGKELFKSNVSSHHLLSRTHMLCVLLAIVGFILSAVGVLGYSWASQPLAVSIFASACMGSGLLFTVIALRF